MKFGKGYGFLMMVLIAGCLLCGCEKRKSESENMIAGNTKETKNTNQEAREQWEKGYDLPLKEAEQAEAATECKKMMEQIQSIYKLADKGEGSNVVLQDEFLTDCKKGKSGSVVIYDVRQDGGINRMKFIYDRNERLRD